MDEPGSLAIGAAVRLVEPLPYLKTADPMPMLRPADLVGPEDIGQVVALKPAAQVAVRFRRGTFLIAASSLRPAASDD